MKTQPWAIALVAATTLLTSFAQILYKMGAPLLAWDFIAIMTNYLVLGGLALYATSFVLLMVAYRGGEASVIYPIFASSYVWVVFFSNYFFGESLNGYKLLGVLLIVLGIAIIARSSARDGVSMEVPA